MRGAEVLRQAVRDRRAIGGFVAYNLETVQAIVAAAERTRLPTILQAGSSAFRHAGATELATLAVALVDASDASIGVHLDHCRSLDEIEVCLHRGYTSLMFDGSALPYEENVELTSRVVGLARDAGAWVEAELVAVAGDEDASTGALAEALTDPDQARDFVAATSVDALAVSVGNVHGFTATEPSIDFDRLERIRECTRIPLVLHGASGLSPATLRGCVARGVAKVNVNTELRRAFLDALSEALPSALEAADIVTTLAAAREAVTVAAAAFSQSLVVEGHE
jgi:tagatose 1,6-diphosphate aldolase GatY/KbaY